jgi:hypothetical protein
MQKRGCSSTARSEIHSALFCIAHYPHATSIDLLRRFFSASNRLALLASLVLLDHALLRQ